MLAGNISEKPQEQFRRLEVIEGLSTGYESIFYVDLGKDKIKAYRVSNRFEAQFPERNYVRDFKGFDSDDSGIVQRLRVSHPKALPVSSPNLPTITSRPGV